MRYSQILMGYNCLYKGSSTLIINLMYHHQSSETYQKPWQAQYSNAGLVKTLSWLKYNRLII